MKGFSPRNLLFMRSFAEAYPDHEQVKQLVSLLPWGHVIRLLQRIKAPGIRDWYAQAALQEGWSRSILELKIDGRAHERQGKALSNCWWTRCPKSSSAACPPSSNWRANWPPGWPALARLRRVRGNRRLARSGPAPSPLPPRARRSASHGAARPRGGGEAQGSGGRSGLGITGRVKWLSRLTPSASSRRLARSTVTP